MKKEDIAKVIEELSLTDNIKLSEIPDMGLYMDQVTTFINNKFAHLKRDEDDKQLTKTMINNYTKAEILMPSVNKK